MEMKRIILFTFFLNLVFFCNAQELEVKSFVQKTNDLSASTNPRLDNNDIACALIKVQLASPGAKFEGNVVGKVKYEKSEYWVYLAKGSKKVKIMSDDYLPLEVIFDNYGIKALESKVTYELRIFIPETGPQAPKVTSQYLVFKVSPVDAVVKVNGTIWPNNNGVARMLVPFGEYAYLIQSKDYHSISGEVTVDDPANKKEVEISLKPNFGWIEVKGTGELVGASVYIDNNYIGKVPVKSEALNSGQYEVLIAKELYNSYSATITVSDNQTSTVTPSLVANFSNITLKVDDDAEIWVNDERKGIRSWTGNLESGNYKIECKKANHETSTKYLEITNQMKGKTFNLNAPTPICGSLNVETNPDYAELFIDGKKMGETPIIISELLIGKHEVKLTKANYADYTETITIAQGETKTVKAALNNSTTVRFSCNADNAMLYVDGKALGSASGSYELGYGNHSLKVTAEGYDDYSDNFTVSPNNSTCTIRMNVTFNGLTFTVSDITFKMLYVEGGTFIMGATSEQGGEGYDNEKPTHSVTLNSFYMGETEVTQALWKAVMGTNPSQFHGNNLPIEMVSWDDCQTFINKLNTMLSEQLDGKQFALPTEAEWEYAARSGKRNKGYKYSGCNNLNEVAWHDDNSESKTHPVGTKQPNELGLYDMCGNVWEWCQDWYSYYECGAQTNPTGPTSSHPNRVYRGGSWDYDARFCRVSGRGSFYPEYRGSDLGFRLSLKNKLDNTKTQSSVTPKESVVEEEIFQIVEKMPTFPGGEQKLLEYIGKNVRYPLTARESGIKGRVFVSFVIELDGSVSNVKVLRGIGGGCDEEAIRVVKAMPKWKPGIQRGKAVRVSYLLPINFQVN